MAGSTEQLEEESRRYGQLETARRETLRQQEEAQASSEQRREGMSFATFLFFLIPSIIADIVDLVTAGTIGWAIGIAVDALLLIGLGFSKNKKKAQIYKVLTGLGLETVLPVLGMLPFRTLCVIWAYASEKPKVKKAVEVGAKALPLVHPGGKVEKRPGSDTM